MKNLLFLLAVMTLVFSCEKDNYEPVNEEVPPIPFNLDARLHLKDSIAPWDIQLSPFSDDIKFHGNNKFVTSHHHTYSELYTGWHLICTPDNQPSWTPNELERLENKYGYTYGSIVGYGMVFGFFHPQGQAIWDKTTVDNFFVEGKTFEFGTEPGQAEISFNKNQRTSLSNSPFALPHLGLVTTPTSNADSYFRIDSAEDVTLSANNENTPGRLLLISFKCKMYKQYSEEFAADLEGTSLVFVPYEE